MSGYWARRTGSALLVLGLVLVLNFVLFRMMPGDPVASIIDPNFSPEAKARLSEVYGLDQSLPVQFLRYVRSTLTFDFGISFLTGRPVMEELKSRLPNTVVLLGTSLVLSSLLGTWLGMKAARKRGSLLEKCVLWSGALSFSFPSFFVQLVLLMAFAAALPLFPLRGTLSVPPPAEGLPCCSTTCGTWPCPSFPSSSWVSEDGPSRAEPHGEDSRRGFHPSRPGQGASGTEHHPGTRLPDPAAAPPHHLSAVPSRDRLRGRDHRDGVFLHGVGRFLLEAVTGHDYPAAGASFFLLALLTVSCNLLSDLLYGLTDPRVRMERGGGR